METFASAVVICLALLLFVAGLSKVTQPEGTRRALSEVLGIPTSLARVGAYGLAASELSVVVLLLRHGSRDEALGLVTILFGAFTAVNARAHRLNAGCGCMGGKSTTTRSDVVRNAALTVVAAAAAAQAWIDGPPAITPLGVAAGCVLAMAVLSQAMRGESSTPKGEDATPTEIEASGFPRRKFIGGLAGLVAAIGVGPGAARSFASVLLPKPKALGYENRIVRIDVITTGSLAANLLSEALRIPAVASYLQERSVHPVPGVLNAVRMSTTMNGHDYTAEGVEVRLSNGGALFYSPDVVAEGLAAVLLPESEADERGVFFWRYGEVMFAGPTIMAASCTGCVVGGLGLILGGVAQGIGCAGCVAAPDPLFCGACVGGAGSTVISGGQYSESCAGACSGGCSQFLACVAVSSAPCRTYPSPCVCNQVSPSATSCGCVDRGGEVCFNCSQTNGHICCCGCCCPKDLGCSTTFAEGEVQRFADEFAFRYPELFTT